MGGRAARGSVRSWWRELSANWDWRSPAAFLERMNIHFHARDADCRGRFAETGHQIIHQDNTKGNPEDLRRVRLAPEFQYYSFEDLLVLFSWIVARPSVEK